MLKEPEDALVVPGDWKQIIIVADKGVESDAFTRACDLQWSGGISCN